MKKISKLIITLFFLFTLLSKEEMLMGQIPVGRTGPNFENIILTTDCCPKPKEILDSIINNAPYIFEGRMIRGGPIYGYKTENNEYIDSYLFEIDKVYRDGGKLAEGTVEIVAKMVNSSQEPRTVGFSESWFIIFAKEVDASGNFDANNSEKLEIFYNDRTYRVSNFIHYDSIPFYKIQENWDYISWGDTMIKIILPAIAKINDVNYPDFPEQYPGTGPFKVIKGRREVQSSGSIEIKYALRNYSYVRNNGNVVKTMLLIPKKNCINGLRFQVCSQIASDSAAITCIKRAMSDWSRVLDIDLGLEVDEEGNPVVNPNNAWQKDSINTISYTCYENDGIQYLNAMIGKKLSRVV